MRSLEDLDYSKLEDQEKFKQIPSEEKEKEVEKAEREAFSIEDEIDVFQKNMDNKMSEEDIEYVRDKMLESEDYVGVSKILFKKKFGELQEEYSQKEFNQLSENEKEEITEKIKTMSEFFFENYNDGHKYPKTDRFFYAIEKELINNKDVFEDKQLLLFVVSEASDIYIEGSAKRESLSGGFWGDPAIWKTDSENSKSSSRKHAGSIMYKLGYFENALKLFKIKNTLDFHSYEDIIPRLFKEYKESGDKSEFIEREYDKFIKNTLDMAGETAEYNLNDADKYFRPGKDQSWDSGFIIAKRRLTKLGISISEQEEMLKPQYERTLQAATRLIDKNLDEKRVIVGDPYLVVTIAHKLNQNEIAEKYEQVIKELKVKELQFRLNRCEERLSDMIKRGESKSEYRESREQLEKSINDYEEQISNLS